MQHTNRKRATVIIVRDGKILLIRRVKPTITYFVFPGGGVDDGETIEEALIRESAEELSVVVTSYVPLCTVMDIEVPTVFTGREGLQDYYCFLVTGYRGTFAIGGPEKESMNESNQYYLEWVELDQLSSMPTLFPQTVIREILTGLTKTS